jgi:hypothetical protein
MSSGWEEERAHEIKAMKLNFSSCRVGKLYQNAAKLVKGITEKTLQLNGGITTEEHIA